MPLWRGGPNTRTLPTVLLTPSASKAADMAHLCVPQNQALGVCRGFAPDIQICGTHRRKNLVNATIISNAEGLWAIGINSLFFFFFRFFFLVVVGERGLFYLVNCLNEKGVSVNILRFVPEMMCVSSLNFTRIYCCSFLWSQVKYYGASDFETDRYNGAIGRYQVNYFCAWEY